MECLVARQPVFDTQKEVSAYQLLFRDTLDSTIQSYSKDTQSATIITETFFSTAIEPLMQNTPLIIPFTTNLLMNRFYELLPAHKLLIEISSELPRNDEFMALLAEIKSAGYRIVSSSSNIFNSQDPITQYVDIVKVDFVNTSRKVQYDKAAYYLTSGIEMLAEGIETETLFCAAEMLGYNYYQGYFFSNPTVLRKGRIHESKLSKLKLLQAVNQADLDFKETSKIIKNDLELSYKLLSYINSAYFGLKRKISSVHHAAVHLGVKELKKWVSLMVIASLNEGKPSELLSSAIIRARICELIAPFFELTERSSELFLMGMFSTLEAMLGLPMEEILKKIPMADDLKDALMGKEGNLGRILNYVIGFQAGKWSLMDSMREHFAKIEENLPTIYADAIQLSEEVLNLQACSK